MGFPLIQIFRWARVFTNLLPFPRWRNAEDARIWVIKCLGVADDLADETSTDVDDKLVAVVRKLVVNSEVWSSFHSLLMYLFKAKQEGKVWSVAEQESFVESVAMQAGVNKSTLQKLIDLIFSYWVIV